jgi:hypothetical protein
MERAQSVAVKIFTLAIACAILPALCDAAAPPKPATSGSRGPMHAAVITTIAADPDNRYLVTVRRTRPCGSGTCPQVDC